ncbi:fucose permease [Longilinea arvoryzae]|uniref:Fucose permease n=1 Tax=Longilinea arvoryzae TaxID=360412 RepID=A0A0S7B868_9CHLR|nr:MFS transporter [Longilinea arvoryzae]GAP13406.1 fucose permease [Longilinea arvoryzae]
MENEAQAVNVRKNQSRVGLVLLAFIAFISLGLPDGLMGVAWPSVRHQFSQPLDSLGYLLIAGTIGYTLSSFFSGKIMSRLGVGGLLAASCALTAGSLLGYTLAPVWWVMVGLALFAGMGGGAIDAAINTYVAAHFAEGLMQWLHASFGVGITLGPIIMTLGLKNTGAWRTGYLEVGSAQLLLAVCFILTAAMWRNGQSAGKEAERNLADYHTPLSETLREPRVWLSILLFFLYTGMEVILGNWAYTLLTESRGIAPQTAGLWTGSYWATFTLGRMLAGLYTRRIGGRKLVAGSLLLALIGGLLLWWNPSNTVGLVGVATIGFAIAPVFPALVSLTSDRVGLKHAANTIGMQISASGLGAALLSSLAGVLARRISLEIIPVYLVGINTLLIGIFLTSIILSRRQDLAR